MGIADVHTGAPDCSGWNRQKSSRLRQASRYLLRVLALRLRSTKRRILPSHRSGGNARRAQSEEPVSTEGVWKLLKRAPPKPTGGQGRLDRREARRSSRPCPPVRFGGARLSSFHTPSVDTGSSD